MPFSVVKGRACLNPTLSLTGRNVASKLENTVVLIPPRMEANCVIAETDFLRPVKKRGFSFSFSELLCLVSVSTVGTA